MKKKEKKKWGTDDFGKNLSTDHFIAKAVLGVPYQDKLSAKIKKK